MTPKKNVALYVRVSSERQANEAHYSIPEQIDRLKSYCKAKEWNVYKIYTDGGQSGAYLDRPALNELVKDAELKKYNMVLVYKLDRLSRRQKDTLHLIEDVFMENDIDFTSVVENLDTSTPTGRAFIGLLSVFAQLEREQIQERMKMGKAGRAKKGKYHAGGTIPIGYNYENGNLIINEYEAMQVRLVFDLRSQGYDIRAIERYMQEHGYKHKGNNNVESSNDWYSNTIRRVLKNKVYLGLIKHHDEYFQGEHEPIIDEDLFYQLQPELEANSIKYSHNDGKYKSLLGGIIYCEKCGAKYAYNTNSVRHPERCEKTGYYGCYSRSKRVKKMVVDPNCKNKNWRSKELDESVVNEIKRLKFEEGALQSIRTTKIVDTQDQTEQIKKRLSQIDAQISKLMDLYTLGSIDIDIIQAKISPLTAEKGNLENTLHELLADQKPNMDDDTVMSLVDSFLEKTKNGTLDERRDILSILIDRIDLNESEVNIHWNFY